MVWAPARSDTSPEHRDVFLGGRNATKMGSTKVKMLVFKEDNKGYNWMTFGVALAQDGGVFYHQFIDGLGEKKKLQLEVFLSLNMMVFWPEFSKFDGDIASKTARKMEPPSNDQ